MTSTAKSNEDDGGTALKSSNSERSILSSAAKIHPGSLSALGDACGVAFLLGNHAKFGLAERCCYHFDLIETLTSLPTGRVRVARTRGRERGDSVSSYEGRARLQDNNENNSIPSHQSHQETTAAASNTPKSCYCGVVSLLECTPYSAGDSRVTKRALRSKHREFNTRAQKSWGRAHRRSSGETTSPKKQQTKVISNSEGHGGSSGLRHCHQPRHLPLPLNPSTRVTFAYELTSIAIVVDASPSATAALFLNENYSPDDECCVPLDRLGKMLKSYLKGMVQPIEVPPVSVTGLGIAFGRWTPNLAVTVAAAYPPSSRGEPGSAGLLVRDFRVVDEKSAMELVNQVEKWALHQVEGVIADRLSGGKCHFGNGVGGRSSQGRANSVAHTSKISSWTSVRSSMKDILAVGDAALATLPQEGRPVILVASDCLNVNFGGVFDYLAETSRSDVPISVINLGADEIGLSFPLEASNDSKSLRDACQLSGGIFLDATLLDSYTSTTAGTATVMSAPFQGDAHFTSKKRSIRPNALQWYSLFSLSPLTPAYSSHSPARSSNLHNIAQNTRQHQVFDSLSTFGGIAKHISQQSFDSYKSHAPISNIEVPFSTQAAALNERTFFVKYSINPVRIKSLLMSRILEGYQARRYGQNTQDPDKVSVHMTLKLADCGVVLHYEVSFFSSPYHQPMIGSAHIKLELSGGDVDFVSLVKKKFDSQHRQDNGMHQGRSISAVSNKTAEKICKLLRWIRKEDYLDGYLCLPGWGDIDHFAKEHSFLRRLETLTKLQRHRHFRTEIIEIVTIKGSKHESHDGGYALFSDLMETDEGEDNLYEAISNWSTGNIVDRTTYFKTLPPRNDDLTYYLVIHVTRCHEATRLFTINLDFHGEIDAEQRLGVVASFHDSIRSFENLVILPRKISENIAVRPESQNSTWTPKLQEYFLHHRDWQIVKDPEVIPLITKRRNQVGNFMIIHSESNRAIFAKFVDNDAVVYQVLARSEGIYVDIHMESNRSLFNPFYAENSAFRLIYEKVKKKDMECAKNLHARTNLLQALDKSAECNTSQAEDIVRLINISSRTERHLRFFKGSSSANNILFELTSDFLASGSLKSQTAKLSFDKKSSVGSYSGNWFIMRVDWYVLSAIHFSTTLMEEDNVTYQQLIFFTAGIATLYPNDDTATRDAVDDDDDIYGLDMILKDIEQAHGKNYAIALYQALRHPESTSAGIDDQDITYALNFCRFKSALKELITLDDLSDELSDDAETMIGIKLHDLIGSLLSPLPGSNGQVFYFNGYNAVENEGLGESTMEPAEMDSLNSNDIDQSHISKQSIDGESDTQSKEPNHTVAQSPMFFKMYFDGNAVSQKDIRTVKKSTMLEAHVSTFDDTKSLPPMHLAVVSKLKRALNSFVVEQQLEKYRFFGDSLTEDNLQSIMRILPETKHHSVDVPLNFFVAKTKCIVSASNPTGSTENDLDMGYSTLLSQIQDRCTLRASNTSFLLLGESESVKVIPYWCFVQVVRSLGMIVIKAYHPSGDGAAREVLEEAHDTIISICHETNQLLMLEDMYHTKSAIDLLVAEDQILVSEDEESKDAGGVEAPFSCQIQYRETMDLNSRCTPRQAIDSLISSTLQNFLLSNRRRMFVYKDEDSNIFYMELAENSHTVELSVRGLSLPGPSITEQLVCLLQKNMLMLTLNAISSVLMKNPYYALLPTDIEFLRSFSDQMSKFDNDYNSEAAKSRRSYALPSHIKDPLIVLLLFRRNITGSTFMHHLHESSEEVYTLTDVLNESDGEMSICIPSRELTFFFNSTPTQDQDPAFQSISTLTEKGRQFSREAGSGIAIIEVSLIHNGSKNIICVEDVREQAGQGGNICKADLVLKQLQGAETTTSFKVEIAITSTTVDTEILHKWVELSLNQVLVTWSIETHIQLSSKRDKQLGSDKSKTTSAKKQQLEHIFPGLSAFEDTIRVATQLPHPASVTFKKENMIRATSLASLTLQLVEMIMGITLQKTKMTSLLGVAIIRYTGKFSMVNIKRIDRSKESIRIESSIGKILKDKAMDNPEYICVFGYGSLDQISVNPSQLFFKEIDARPSQETAFSMALSIIKKKHPSLFTRHLAFILRVTKSSRSLLAYNMHPQIWMNIKQRFSDIDDETSKTDETHRISLHTKCCSWQHGIPTIQQQQPIQSTANPKVKVATVDTKQQEKGHVGNKDDEPSSMRGPKRRIPRPKSMLRPKLIGKSVEGSAMQAVTASRLRASSRPIPPQRSTSSSGKTPSTIAPQKDKDKKAARRISSTTKDAGKAPSVRNLSRSSLIRIIRDLSTLLHTPVSTLGTPKLSQSTIQLMLRNFLQFTGKENENKVLLARLFTYCFGNYLGSWTVQHLKCDDQVSVESFLQQMLKTFTSKHIVSWGTIRLSDGSLPFLVASKELVTSAVYQATMLLQIVTVWDTSRRMYVFTCRLWLINSINTPENKMRPQGYARQKTIEQEGAVIDALACDFVNHLNLESEILNFAGCRLARIASRMQKPSLVPSTASLLRSMITKVEEQPRHDNMDYYLERRFLCPSTFLHDLPKHSYKKSTICTFLTSNCHHYHLSDCGGDDPCYSGSLKVVGFVVHFFITWHETVESALDIFILTETKGQRLDVYVGKEGSSYAEKLSHVILHSAMCAVQDILRRAAWGERKQHLWKMFGTDYSTSSVDEKDILEMIRTSHKIDMAAIDRRIESLFDDFSNLQISWHMLFSQIHQSSPFTHCITFTSNGAVYYVVYVKCNDLFLCFKQQNLTLDHKILLLLDQSTGTNVDKDFPTTSNELTGVVEEFINHATKWLFVSCCQFNVN